MNDIMWALCLIEVMTFINLLILANMILAMPSKSEIIRLFNENNEAWSKAVDEYFEEIIREDKP